MTETKLVDVAAESGHEQLLVKQFKAGPLPTLREQWPGAATGKGPALVYSRQCPWVARFVEEVKPILKKMNLTPAITELKTPAQLEIVQGTFANFE